MADKFKLSYYLTIVPTGDEYLIAQGITARFLRLKKKLFDEVCRHLDKPGNPEVEEAKRRLRGMEMIIARDKDEQELIRFYHALGLKSFDYHSCFNILLTFKCNFSCVYCLQNENASTISKEVMDKALDYLFDHARKNKLRKLSIRLAGGEPMLCVDEIEYMVNQVRARCRESKMVPEFVLVTNGSIFHPKIGSLFRDRDDLHTVQITLDGPKAVHDKRRPFKGGGGSYDRIVENIPRWLELSRYFSVRVNIDQRNYSCFPALLKELGGRKGKKIVIIPAPCSEGYGKGEAKEDLVSKKEIKDLIDNCAALAEKMGLVIEKGAFDRGLKCRTCCCEASVPFPTQIGPAGELGCCYWEMENKEKCIGSVFSGIDNKRAAFWRKYAVLNIEKCLRCKHIFFCGGPCPSRFARGLPVDTLCGDRFREILEENPKNYGSS